MSASNAAAANYAAWAGIANELAHADLRRQQAEESKAQTQERLLNVLMGRRAFENALGYQEAVQKSLGQESDAATTPKPATVQSIAAEQAINADPNKEMFRTLAQDRARVLQNIKLGQSYGQNITPWVNELGRIDAEMRRATEDIAKRQSADRQEAAQIISGIDSPASADAALRHISETFGKKQALDLYGKLEVNPQDGEVLWNDNNKNIFAQYRNQFIKAEDQVKNKQTELEYRRKQAEDANRNFWKEQQFFQKDRIVAEQQAGATQRNRERIANSAEWRALAAGTKVNEIDQKQVDAVAKELMPDKYQAGDTIATKVEAKLTNPKQGYADVTEPEARALVEQFKMMINSYRPRVGGKYQEDQINKMDGLLQKAERYVQTWGGGSKVLAKDTLLNVTREMRTLANFNNVDVLRRELSILQNTNERGGNAAVINRRGNLDQAVRSGMAEIKTDPATGKSYVSIPRPGTKPTPNDVFELPSAPADWSTRFQRTMRMSGGEDAGDEE